MQQVVDFSVVESEQTAVADTGGESPAVRPPLQHVVLLCHFGRAGYNVQRALHGIAARTFLVHDKHAGSVRWSRDCELLHACDELNTADAAHIAEQINVLHRAIGIDCVIPADIEASLLVSKMLGTITPPIFPIPDTAVLHRLDNKWTFNNLCLEHGVAVPKTLHFKNNADFDARAVDNTLGYPVIVKPEVGFGQRDIVILRSEAAARSFREADSHPNGIVVQEIVAGQDWALSVFARNGVVTHWVTWECPEQLEGGPRTRYGVSRFQTTHFRDHPALVEMGKQLIAATGFSGIANFDARLDETGRMVLFECNPRLFNRILAARMCGLNFIAAGLDNAPIQRSTLAPCDYYPWQEMFTLRGWRNLLTGRWDLKYLRRDLYEMIRDPLPPLVRKLTKEENQ